MSTKKTAIASAHSKKAYKKEIYAKLETALQDLKNNLGDKEFQHRIKKAAKIFLHGLHSKDFSSPKNDVAKPGEVGAKKIKGLKKAFDRYRRNIKKNDTEET